MLDKMCSAERMDRFYKGERTDRVPVLSCASLYAGKQKNISAKEFYFDAEKSYWAQKEIYDREGYDDLPCYDFPSGEILDFGGSLYVPDEGALTLPIVRRFPITTLQEAESFTVPKVEEGLYTVYRKSFLDYAKARGQSGVSINVGSPFTMLGTIIEVGMLLRWLVKEPALIRELLDKMVEYLDRRADYLIATYGVENCSVSSNYPLETGDLISAKMFEKFSLPSMLDIHERMKRKGIKSFGIHLCGNQKKHLAYFKELHLQNRSFISADEQNDLQEVARVLGRDNIYAGNISSRLFTEGSPEQVYQASRKIVEDMQTNPGGFVLMPSCDLPMNAKTKNLRAMLQAARDSAI